MDLWLECLKKIFFIAFSTWVVMDGIRVENRLEFGGGRGEVGM